MEERFIIDITVKHGKFLMMSLQGQGDLNCNKN